MLFLKFYNSSDKIQYSKKEILFKAIGFYIFYQIAVFISISILFFILKHQGLNIDDFRSTARHLVPEKWYIIMFLAPVFEEFIFRLGLSFKKIEINISISFLCLGLLNMFWGNLYHNIIIKLLISILLFFSLSFFSQSFWTRYSEKYGKYTIIIISLLFGLMHIFNFPRLSIAFLPIYLWLCLPQIVMGITFSYLRLNAGFIFSIIAHILINSFFVLLVIIK